VIAPRSISRCSPRGSISKTGDKSPGRLQVVAAYYEPAQADDRIVVGWLLHCGHLRREICATPRASIELGAFVQMVAGAATATGRARGNAAGIRDDLVAQDKQKRQAALGDDEKVRRFRQ
jgi:hypothetical protein